MNESYQTSDVYLAAYLKFIGKQLAKVEKISPKKVTFIFADDCEMEADDFYNGEAKQFLNYARTFKDMKAMLYTSMESSKEYEAEPDPERVRKFKV
jgi:hypothetical protein